MIDGVKLLCNLNPDQWTNNKNLSFRSWTDTETGEVASNNKHANINGLHLSIIPGEKEMFCNVRGSLPKYYTGGETNAIDYTFRDFLTTTELLNENLNISPGNAVLRGFEFGVNINLPFDFSNIYESIKSYKQHAPKTNTKTKGILFDFQQYQIKIYDKGMQEAGKKSRVMRFEISVKKMDWVKHLGIKTIADMQNPIIWAELSKILLTAWNEIIFVDKSLKYRLMTNHEQKKYLYYFDAHYWTNLNKKQYHTAKNHLNKLQYIYEGNINAKQSISNLIAEKCRLLATKNHHGNGYDLTELQAYKNTFSNPEISQRLEKQKRERFNHLDEWLNTGTISPSFYLENVPENIRNNSLPEIQEKETKPKPKKSNCMNCKKSLSEKKSTAKFCSLKCKNQHNGKLRTQARQKKRQDEKKRIGKVVKELPKTDLSLLVIYRTPDGLQYADYLKQSEINAPPEWIRQIKKVLITDDKTAPPLEFTTLRAKKLIREITNINTKI